MESDGAGAYRHTGKWAEPYGKFNEGNPYVKAFFEWWPELSKELQEIRITGGEPAMSHQFWQYQLPSTKLVYHLNESIPI